MKTALIYHKDSDLNRDVLPKWLSSFSNLVCLVEINEDKSRKYNRLRNEYQRTGILGVLDALLFKIYYKVCLANKLTATKFNLRRKSGSYGELVEKVPKVIVESPNDDKAVDFLKQYKPDMVIARCKFILKEKVFAIPTVGTFVMHPGICPEYRNSHGCLWAMINKDYEKIGMTLLKVNKGIDTGPIFGYFKVDFGLDENPLAVQEKVVFDNLEAIRSKLEQIYNGEAEAIKIDANRKSGFWGQPKLSSFIKWKVSK